MEGVKYPRKKYEVTWKVGVHDLEELRHLFNDLFIDIREGTRDMVSSHCGWLNIEVNEGMTEEQYKADLKKWLESTRELELHWRVLDSDRPRWTAYSERTKTDIGEEFSMPVGGVAVYVAEDENIEFRPFLHRTDPLEGFIYLDPCQSLWRAKQAVEIAARQVKA